MHFCANQPQLTYVTRDDVVQYQHIARAASVEHHEAL
jgi:hypothetical protein